MTNSTKNRIAHAFKELVCRKSFHKITINDIATECHMTRENFYYHFRDKYDIVSWILVHELLDSLPYEEDFTLWLCQLVKLFNENRNVYVRIVKEVGRETVRNHLAPYVKEKLSPSIEAKLDPAIWNNRREKTEYVTRFFTNAFIEFLYDSVIDNEINDYEVFRYNLELLMSNYLPFVRIQKENNED